MDSITNDALFSLKDFLNFSRTVGDLVRCTTDWSVFDQVPGLGERLE